MTWKFAPLLGIALAFAATPVRAEGPLSLDEALNLALGRTDPSVARYTERAAGRLDAAIAAGALPDPMVSVGVANLPLDNLSLDREAMTQLRLGVRQSFPRGHTRSLMAATEQEKAAEMRAEADAQSLLIARAVTAAWHEARYSYIAEQELTKVRAQLEGLKAQQESSFAAAGGAALERIYRTELEIALLDDRLASAVQDRERAVAGLARFIGQAAAERQPMPGALPSPTLPAGAQIEDAVANHPSLMASKNREAQAGTSVALAHEAYKPAWSLELDYGARFGDRADFGSAIVTFDLPLWTGKRQDPALSAAKRQAQAAAFETDTLRLNMLQSAHTLMADLRGLTTRLDRFDSETIKRATDAAGATRNAYQAGTVDFAELVRAEIALLDTRLRAEMLRRDIALARANLAYLMGETR
ncbi:MAG: hypothetical protein EP335_19085 [Alphaproteobacteria bacterium]|nr:MAG: hypothetical protein EP335_19085 [Alphaproteobacteria bacterium]